MEGSPCDSSLPATQKTPTEEEEKEKKNDGELIRGVELCQQEELEGRSIFTFGAGRCGGNCWCCWWYIGFDSTDMAFFNSCQKCV